MAYYYAKFRSNYFVVTDEHRLREIIENCSAEDEIHLFTYSDDGTKRFAIGCSGTIHGLIEPEDEDETGNFDLMLEELQKIIVHGDAMILTEIGYEKLRYLSALSFIVTSDSISSINLLEDSFEKAKEMLSNSEFTTRMDY